MLKQLQLHSKIVNPVRLLAVSSLLTVIIVLSLMLSEQKFYIQRSNLKTLNMIHYQDKGYEKWHKIGLR